MVEICVGPGAVAGCAEINSFLGRTVSHAVVAHPLMLEAK